MTAVDTIKQVALHAGVETQDKTLFGNVSFAFMLRKVRAKDKDFNGTFLELKDEASLDVAIDFVDIHLEAYRKQAAPSMTTLVLHHAAKLGLETHSPAYRALVLASAVAEANCGIDDRATHPEYHNVYHFLDVTAMAGNLAFVTDSTLSKHEKALTLLAAVIHDIGHEGYGNPKDDPFYNEKHSFAIARPLLEKAGLSAEDLQAIETILLTTSPNGPNVVLKEAAKAQREATAMDWAKLDPNNHFACLRVLEHNPVLTQMAAIVADADLFASSGAGLAANKLMSENLTKEVRRSGIEIDFNTHGARKFFLDTIVGKEGYASTAARAYNNASFMLLREATAAFLGEPETAEEARARKESTRPGPRHS